MKKLMSVVASVTLIVTSTTSVISCADINYVRLSKDLNQWKTDSYGLFNNETGIKLLIKNNTSDESTAIYYYDKNTEEGENLNSIYEDCYDKGKDSKNDRCYLNGDNIVRSYIYYYELETKSDLKDSLLALDSHNKPDMALSFAKINSNLDWTIKSDGDSKLIHIEDNSRNTPGYFSFYLAFGVVISADKASPDGYFGKASSSKSDHVIPVLISFQEGF